MELDVLKMIKKYFADLKQQHEQELLEKKNRIISFLEKDWTKKEIEHFNFTLIGNSAGWIGGDYTEKDIKMYILRNNRQLFDEVEVQEWYQRIRGTTKVK